VNGPFYIGIRRTPSGGYETVSCYQSKRSGQLRPGIARVVQWNRTRDWALVGLRCEAGKMGRS
jgi:hypothetical protein